MWTRWILQVWMLLALGCVPLASEVGQEEAEGESVTRPVGIRVGKLTRNDERWEAKDDLTSNDMVGSLRVGAACKVYSLTLKKDEEVQIDLSSKNIDAYLYLLGKNFKVLASDDNGGGGTNARIPFRAREAGTYQILATTSRAAQFGDFTLTVQPTLLEQATRAEASGDLVKATALIREALAAARKSPVRGRPDLVQILSSLADLLERQDNWKEALPLRLEALASLKKASGTRSWRVADANRDLDTHLRLAKADKSVRQAHADAAAFHGKAIRASAEKNYTDAVALFEKELKAREASVGQEHVLTALARFHLGQSHMNVSKPDKAELHLQRAVSILRKATDTHPVLASATFALGQLHLVRKETDKATPLFKETLQIRQTLFHSWSVEITDVRFALVQLEETNGDFRQAAQNLIEAIPPLRQRVGSGQADYTAALKRLDTLFQAERAAAKKSERPTIVDRQEVDLEQLFFARQFDFDDLGARSVLAVLADFRASVHGKDHWRAQDDRRGIATLNRLLELTPAERTLLRQADETESKLPNQYAKGNYAAALAACQQTLQIRRELLGITHPDTARSLHDLGMITRATGDFHAAIQRIRQSWEMYRTTLGDAHPLTAASQATLGAMQLESGDDVSAAINLREAIERLERQVDPKHPAFISALNNLGVLSQNLGDHAGAEKRIARAYELHQSAQKDSVEMRVRRQVRFPAGLTNPLSGGMNWVNNLQTFVHFLKTHDNEMRIGHAGIVLDDRPIHAKFLNNLGRVLAGKKDYSGAEKRWLESVALYDRLDAEAAKNKTSLPSEVAASRIVSLNNLALARMLQKKYDEAEKDLESSLIARKALYTEEHQLYANGLNSLAWLFAARKDYRKAEELLRRAVAIHGRTVGEWSLTWTQTRSNHALALAALGRDAEALKAMSGVIEAYGRRLRLNAGMQSEREQLLQLRALRGQLDAYLTVAQKAKESPEETYALVLAWKGAVFARQQLQRERLLVLRAHDDEATRFQAELDDLGRRMSQLSREENEKTRKMLHELSDQRERLEQGLARRASEVALRRKAERLTPAELRAVLPRGTVLLDYLEYRQSSLGGEREPRLLVHVLCADKKTVRLDLGPLAPIEKAIEQWRQGLHLPPGDDENTPAVALRRLLWEPVEKYLTGAKLVLISPDGALGRLPFGALPGKKKDRFLLEEMALATVPVPRLLSRLLEEKAITEPTLLLVGDVDFSAPSGEGEGRLAPQESKSTWAKLPGTRTELVGVRSAFEKKHTFPVGQTTVLAGGRATEGRFRQSAAGHRYLHLATHGFFAGRATRSFLEDAGEGEGEGVHPGLLSGLVLAGANNPPRTGRDDGVLTALEVAELDLSACEMVVLSACETGLGKLAGGEGALGLQRAFQVAGARTVLASLWSVPDEATAVLMQQFYANLWEKGMGKLEALLEAQRWMLAHGARDPQVQRGMERRTVPRPTRDGRLPPYFWGAFCLSGDWR